MTNNVARQQNLSTTSKYKFKIKLIKKSYFDISEIHDRIDELKLKSSRVDIYQQLQNSNKVVYNYKNLTLPDIEKAMSDLFFQRTDKKRA